MNQNIALLVSDVDGTLVTRAKELRAVTIAAVVRLREAGIAFTLISARPPSGLTPLVEQLVIDVPVGAFNGGTIFTPHAVLARHHIAPEVTRGVLALADATEATPWLFADDRWYITDPDNARIPREKLSSAQEPVVVEDLTPLCGRADKLTLVCDTPGVLADLAQRGTTAYGRRATIALSQHYFLDVTASVANKGDGVAALAAAIGVPLSRVAVIGDMANDLPMFARAMLAIAMGQAGEDVRAAAHHVTASNEDDGVAHAIDALLLSR